MPLYAGLISGTSMDGVEAVALQIDADGMQVRGAIHTAYPEILAGRLRAAVADPRGCDLDMLGELDANIGEVFADAVLELLRQTGLTASAVRAIGSHGQTVRHRPDAGYTVQINQGALLAERCGIDVVCDFRARDVVAGGQGAPLVPAFHAERFGVAGHARAVLNLGGIANLTLLGTDGSVKGFDTGPA